MNTVWFWSRVVSPHMASVAVALARLGCFVTYVVEQSMSDARACMGWSTPGLPGVTLLLMDSERSAMQMCMNAPNDAVHITQGVRANGLVGAAQRALAKRGGRYWIAMETVDDPGLIGLCKRLLYRVAFWRCRRCLAGVLAIGRNTTGWVSARGVPGFKVLPFAYFLAEQVSDAFVPEQDRLSDTAPFTVMFAGRLISLKRVGLLIDALAALPGDLAAQVRLQVVGSGPLEESLRAAAALKLGDRVNWVGQVPMDDARRMMADADCLVLPSRYDGWGAVVSEALMAGVPVICSDACGASEVVLASGVGGVFGSGDVGGLTDLLTRQVSAGRISGDARLRLTQWARCLGGEAGARYLLDIFLHVDDKAGHPAPPWTVTC